MKTMLLMIAAFVLTGAACGGAATPGGAPAALLLSCAGTVSVIRPDGSQIAGQYGLALDEGDEVRTGAASQAEIHFRNGTWVTVGAGSSLVIRAASPRTPPIEPSAAAESFASVQSFLKLRDAEGVSTLAALRSGGGQAEIRIESPCNTAIRGGRPVFRWSAADSASELRLKLYDENGVRWQRDLRGTTSVAYPADAEPLESGTTYSWTLETTDPLRFPPIRTQAAFFEVLSASQEQSLAAALETVEEGQAPTESAYRLARASAYFRYRLLEDAIAETRLAIEADAGNAALHTILARLYAETGRTAEAMEEYRRLIERR